MYEVGYSDLKAFCEVFRKITGLSPLAHRNKYNKEMVAFKYILSKEQTITDLADT